MPSPFNTHQELSKISVCMIAKHGSFIHGSVFKRLLDQKNVKLYFFINCGHDYDIPQELSDRFLQDSGKEASAFKKIIRIAYKRSNLRYAPAVFKTPFVLSYDSDVLFPNQPYLITGMVKAMKKDLRIGMTGLVFPHNDGHQSLACALTAGSDWINFDMRAQVFERVKEGCECKHYAEHLLQKNKTIKSVSLVTPRHLEAEYHKDFLTLPRVNLVVDENRLWYVPISHIAAILKQYGEDVVIYPRLTVDH